MVFIEDDDTVLLEFENTKDVDAEDDLVLLEHSGKSSLWLPVTCLREVGKPKAQPEQTLKKASPRKPQKAKKPKKAPVTKSEDNEAEKEKVMKVASSSLILFLKDALLLVH